eukprot:CAMPEP_0113581794 /NCGR_PEP_ID=MMETSP0015_2-20120614/31518_1 /TAXON_ID=2838 /ORGANISM="Odontella" /LENGTH=404 /DNA_ID=CAMNT_0000486317 /DNA_START=20 /DNA_END=1234 /DNA_ORIENTATION=+ /assembly_acc=CAM_ASM_000160
MTEGNAIICAGLSCLDLQLLGCTQSGPGEESIEKYDAASYCAGGSASMTATTLGLLLKADARDGVVSGDGGDDDANAQGEGEGRPPRVHVLTKLGSDLDGERMMSFYASAGADPSLALIDPTGQTSMAVLPVFNDGRRGCFVNLACNESFSPDELLGRLDGLPGGGGGGGGGTGAKARAFLFGYPHLLPKMQGEHLRDMLAAVRSKLGGDRVLVGVDLNGVTASNHTSSLLTPALGQIDVLHLNEEEASIICGSEDNTSALHEGGCAVVLLSLGSRGARISVTPDADRLSSAAGRLNRWTPGEVVRVPAFSIRGGAGGDDGKEAVNANGAGDALFASFCLAATWPRGEDEVRVGPREAGLFASLAARQRCDVRTRDGREGSGMEGAEGLMARVKIGDLPEAISS